MMVPSGQDGPKFKCIHMTCRDCVQLPLDVDGIDSSIDTQMLKTPHVLLFQFASIYYGGNTYIGTLKKDGGASVRNAAPKALNKNP